ncbi:T9SS type A sorting domain-containing protein [Sporocytophaga myxococcoides]|uniref:T9SS type A sorting domain-containing protein n=1 Tax=Sporocytophaga myxococcoides TaxID=153721 RepID=UPI0012E0A700|nr:T9SS type A sorting domain-containing protein [Sporocytophaga myxococcoides]
MTDKEQTLLGQRITSTQGSATVVYTNPLTIAKLPLAYNGTTSDDYNANYVASGLPMTLSGSVSTTYDGYGTLKTQFGTYNNVVRLKATKIDNSEFSGATTILKSVSYAYYIPGYTTSLFAITEITTSIKMEGMGEVKMGTTKAAYLYDPSFLTSNKNAYLQDLKLSVSPNPASDIISLDFQDLSSDHYKIRVTEQDGSTVLEDNIFASKGESHSINLSELKSGLYFLEVYSSNGKTVKKIVKM